MSVIINRRAFITGLVLLICFGATLAVILSPVFQGVTGLHLVDGIFNSLSKGSSYFIPDLAGKADQFTGTKMEVTFRVKSAEELEKMKTLFLAAGAQTTASGESLRVTGDLGLVARRALADAEALFQSGETPAPNQYGFSGKEAVYYWWAAFKQLKGHYLQENKPAEAVFVENVSKKALEPAYNYDGIPPARFREVAGVSIGSLVFYVVYTIWYGFAIMLIFEGLGITASKPAKKAEA